MVSQSASASTPDVNVGYQCADDEWFAVGANEPKFSTAFLNALSIDDVVLAAQNDVTERPALRKRVAEIFAQRTRAEWTRFSLMSRAAVPPCCVSTS